MGLQATTLKNHQKTSRIIHTVLSDCRKIYPLLLFFIVKKGRNNLFSIRYSFILSFNNSSSCSELIYSLYVLGYFILFYCLLKLIPKHLNIFGICICNNVYHLWCINIPIKWMIRCMYFFYGVINTQSF